MASVAEDDPYSVQEFLAWERTRIRQREHADEDLESERRRRRRDDEVESESRRRRQRESDEVHRENLRWADEREARLREEEAREDPASKPAMVALRVPEVGETREKECAVCLEDFVAGGRKLRTMPCSHSFHQRCIFDWLCFNRTCPVCRFLMPSEKQRLIDEIAAGDAGGGS